ncbi:MAG: undecaprenyl-diphosphate phosphatase [Byssovorax sp.]
MSWFSALLLGLIEGLTEFLPVSSTGHLILLGNQLGHDDDAAKTLEVVVQLGAVLAVVVYFRARLGKLLRGILDGSAEERRLGAAVTLAFVPAAVAGLLFHKKIEDLLFAPMPVAAALIAGGVVMVAIELARKNKQDRGDEGLEKVTVRRALSIGLAQCLSLWPGTSRSMTTIVGGQLSGLSTPTAADFSFLLAVPTLGAATLYKLLKSGRGVLAMDGGLVALLVGTGVSFVVALLVIAAFLRFLKRFGLLPFGVYRIVLGGLVLYLGARGVIHAPPPHGAEAPAEHASIEK